MSAISSFVTTRDYSSSEEKIIGGCPGPNNTFILTRSDSIEIHTTLPSTPSHEHVEPFAVFSTQPQTDEEEAEFAAKPLQFNKFTGQALYDSQSQHLVCLSDYNTFISFPAAQGTLLNSCYIDTIFNTDASIQLVHSYHMINVDDKSILAVVDMCGQLYHRVLPQNSRYNSPLSISTSLQSYIDSISPSLTEQSKQSSSKRKAHSTQQSSTTTTAVVAVPYTGSLCVYTGLIDNSTLLVVCQKKVSIYDVMTLECLVSWSLDATASATAQATPSSTDPDTTAINTTTASPSSPVITASHIIHYPPPSPKPQQQQPSHYRIRQTITFSLLTSNGQFIVLEYNPSKHGLKLIYNRTLSSSYYNTESSIINMMGGFSCIMTPIIEKGTFTKSSILLLIDHTYFTILCVRHLPHTSLIYKNIYSFIPILPSSSSSQIVSYNEPTMYCIVTPYMIHSITFTLRPVSLATCIGAATRDAIYWASSLEVASGAAAASVTNSSSPSPSSSTSQLSSPPVNNTLLSGDIALINSAHTLPVLTPFSATDSQAMAAVMSAQPPLASLIYQVAPPRSLFSVNGNGSSNNNNNNIHTNYNHNTSDIDQTILSNWHSYVMQCDLIERISLSTLIPSLSDYLVKPEVTHALFAAHQAHIKAQEQQQSDELPQPSKKSTAKRPTKGSKRGRVQDDDEDNNNTSVTPLSPDITAIIEDLSANNLPGSALLSHYQRAYNTYHLHGNGNTNIASSSTAQQKQQRYHGQDAQSFLESFFTHCTSLYTGPLAGAASEGAYTTGGCDCPLDRILYIPDTDNSTSTSTSNTTTTTTTPTTNTSSSSSSSSSLVDAAAAAAAASKATTSSSSSVRDTKGMNSLFKDTAQLSSVISEPCSWKGIIASVFDMTHCAAPLHVLEGLLSHMTPRTVRQNIRQHCSIGTIFPICLNSTRLKYTKPMSPLFTHLVFRECLRQLDTACCSNCPSMLFTIPLYILLGNYMLSSTILSSCIMLSIKRQLWTVLSIIISATSVSHLDCYPVLLEALLDGITNTIDIEQAENEEKIIMKHTENVLRANTTLTTAYTPDDDILPLVTPPVSAAHYLIPRSRHARIFKPIRPRIYESSNDDEISECSCASTSSTSTSKPGYIGQYKISTFINSIITPISPLCTLLSLISSSIPQNVLSFQLKGVSSEYALLLFNILSLILQSQITSIPLPLSLRCHVCVLPVSNIVQWLSTIIDTHFAHILIQVNEAASSASSDMDDITTNSLSGSSLINVINAVDSLLDVMLEYDQLPNDNEDGVIGLLDLLKQLKGQGFSKLSIVDPYSILVTKL